MTNPDNVIGTNSAYGSRTSVNAFNDICQIASGRGVLSGWSVAPKSGLTLKVGGVAGIRDVAIAEDHLGNRTTINNRIGTSVDVVITTPSTSSKRFDAIVVYAKNPAQAENTTQDAPSVCGIIAVKGGSASVSDDQIRSAISADGGGGSTAYYAVLATIEVPAGATTITSANIKTNHIAISASDIADGEITTRMIANSAITNDKIANSTIKQEKIDWSSFDTGWITCPFATGYKGSTNVGFLTEIRARIIGNVLYLQGGVSPNSGNFTADSEVVVATLPTAIFSKLTIDKNKRFFISGANSSAGFGSVNASGSIYVSPNSAIGWTSFNMSMPIN